MLAAATPRRGDSRLARAAAAVWVAAILVTLGVGAFGSPALQARFLDDGPGCIFRMTTGVVCAFCGMTHATIALGRGDLAGAFEAHPLAPVVVFGALYLLGLTAVGRADALLRGHRPYGILGVVAVVWAANLTL
jgi:hypothetical protein